MMNVRIQFSKGYEVKYVSHLDLMRTFNRMLMRSGLPVSYTQGFNPHIILTFAQPLSVGVTSDGEYAEFQMEEQCTFDEIKDKLNAAAPEGIEILKVTDELAPKFKELYAAAYKVTLQCNQPKEALLNVLNREVIPVEKKTKKGLKEINIKPLLFDFSIEEEAESLMLRLKLASGSERNLNPDLLLKAFEKEISGFRMDYKSVHRIKLLTKENEELMK